MAESRPEKPLTEPLITQDTFATGVDVDVIDGQFRLTAWVEVADERRIVARLVIPQGVARKLVTDLRAMTNRGGH